MSNSIEDNKQRKPNLWLEHVKSVRSNYPEMIYKDVLKIAKDSYKPVEKPKKEKKIKSNEDFTSNTKRNMKKAKQKLEEELQNESIEAY
jgi:hypothetical protein